jgi:predicted nucleotidyltransferase
MKIKAREGDFLEDSHGTIYDVKGLIHPPDRIVAFPRYIKDAMGKRKRNNVLYKKIYTFTSRFQFLEQQASSYLVHDWCFDERLCELTFNAVKRHYMPINRLHTLRYHEASTILETQALQLLQKIKECTGVPWRKLGVSGSLLVKLLTKNSDIDLVIYGEKNCRRVYEALKILQQDEKSMIKPYAAQDLDTLYEFRSQETQIDFKDFKKMETRKRSQGKIEGRDYFIRFIKEWNEIEEKYGFPCYRNVGYAKIQAEIGDDSEAIFTPCCYKLKDVKILVGPRIFPIAEIASFRGRFCEQAKRGEIVVAQGKIEHVIERRQKKSWYRLLIGNNRSDFLISQTPRR